MAITDNAGGLVHLGPLTLGQAIQNEGGDVLVHLACLDRKPDGPAVDRLRSRQPLPGPIREVKLAAGVGFIHRSRATFARCRLDRALTGQIQSVTQSVTGPENGVASSGTE